MGPAERYYVVVDNNNVAIDYEDPITGYTETYKFHTEADAWNYILEMISCGDAMPGEYHVESYKW